LPTRRQEQVGEAVQQHMSALLQRELKDPRIGFATVTHVEMSPDLKHARIFISVMGSAEEQQNTMAALDSGKGFIRRELGSRLNLRNVPDVSFRLDTSAEYSDRISRLLNELKAEEEARKSSE
jgi:ribosome-binding factor A